MNDDDELLDGLMVYYTAQKLNIAPGSRSKSIWTNPSASGAMFEGFL